MAATTSGLVFAVAQMSSQGDLEENLEKADDLVARAAARGATMVLLPENFAYFGDEEGKRNVAEDLAAGGPITDRLRSIAERRGVVVIAGGMPERSKDAARPHNACVVFERDGRIGPVYRKVHLFDVELADGARYCESASTMPGEEAVVATVDGVKVGLSVCYDVRFPELYRALSDRGAEVLVVPAAFTLTTGKDHWHVLLRARAIEAQAYVLAAAQWGKHPRGRVTFGKSCIIDPWGEIVAQVSEGEGVAVAAFDRDYLRRVRANLPALEHRRLRASGPVGHEGAPPSGR